MKLHLEDETASLSLVEDLVDESVISENSSPKVKKWLADGIEAAKQGDRSEARHLLIKVTEEDADNETAWLWLASISEYPEELLIYLNNVLKLNPANEKALNWLDETKVLLAKTFVQRGVDAENEGNREFAKQCFLQAIVHDENSEIAWLWLASISDSDDEKISHLRKVLKINPDNSKASGSYQSAKNRVAESQLAKARLHFSAGEYEKAERCADECLEYAPDSEDALLLKAEICEAAEDKIKLLSQILKLNPDNQDALALLGAAKKLKTADSLRMVEEAIADGKTDHASDLLDILIEESPDTIEVWILKAKISDSNDSKIAYLNMAVEIDPSNQDIAKEISALNESKAKSLVEEAKRAISEGRKDNAEELVNEALDRMPDYEDAILVKCELSDSLDEKSDLLDFVLKNNPDNEDALNQRKDLERQLLDRRIETIRAAIESGDLNSAGDELDNAISASPGNEELLWLKFELARTPEEKESILEEVVSVSPESDRAIQAKDQIRRERAGRIFAEASSEAAAGNKGEADRLLDQVLELSPDSADAWLLKAHLADGFDAKISCFEKVLELNPADDAAAANLASLRNIVKNTSSRPDQADTDDPAQVVPELNDEEPQVEAVEVTDFNAAEEELTVEVSAEESVDIEDSEECLALNPEEDIFHAASESEDAHEEIEVEETLSDPDFSEADFDEEFDKEFDKVLFSSSDSEEPVEIENAAVEVETMGVQLDDGQVEDVVSRDAEFSGTVEQESQFDLSEESNSDGPADFDAPTEEFEFSESSAEVEVSGSDEDLGPIEMPSSADELSATQPATSYEFDVADLPDPASSSNGDVSGVPEADDRVNASCKSILVVDDSPTIRKLISEKLENCGHKTICAVDGPDALEKVEEQKPDLILLDITMPGMDGYEVCKLIRENESAKDVPVIMVSGKDGYFDEDLGESAGSTNYISKPFGPEALMKIVNEHIT